MIFLALLSGLINLTSQVVYQKVVSMVAGDLYTTFLAVTLTFILGSALGSYFGHRIRPYLALIEIGAGIFSVSVAIFLSGSFYAIDMPLGIVMGGLCLPAFAIGTHVPLYAYYLRWLRFGWVYGLYHAGGVLGLLAVEWYFIHAGSLRESLFALGLAQVAIGSAIVALTWRGRFVFEKSPHQALSEIFKFVRVQRREAGAVVVASSLSFYGVLWALKSQVMLTETFRLHATSISAAVFFWMAVAGAWSSRIRHLPIGALMIAMAAAFLAVYAGFADVTVWITDLYSGQVRNYMEVSFLLSLFLTIPVLFSSWVFIHATQRTADRWGVDFASGSLNLIAGVGNLLGFAVAGGMAVYFWSQEYFVVAVIVALSCGIFLNRTKRMVIVACTLIVASAWCFQSELESALFQNRVLKDERGCYETVDTSVYSHPLTTMGLFTRRVRAGAGADCIYEPPARYYVIDGHISHDIWRGIEFLVGFSSAAYISPERSLVIGIGSGQAAWGVAAISKRTDLVEISPVVIENLRYLKQVNGDLLQRQDIEFHLKDGFSFVRDCTRGAYDLVFNTSTYPSSFNASKLYSREFVSLVKRCLSEKGVYQTYFDSNSVQSETDFFEFIAPIKEQFKYVDVLLRPYPQVYAYNTLRAVQTLGASSFVQTRDFDFIRTRYPEVLSSACRDRFMNVAAFKETVNINTLDQAFLERNSIRNYVRTSLIPGVPIYPVEDFVKLKIECL